MGNTINITIMKQFFFIFIVLIFAGCKINRYVTIYYIDDDNYIYGDDTIRIVSDAKYSIIFDSLENYSGLYAIIFINKNEDGNDMFINKITLSFKNLNFQVTKDCLIESQFSKYSHLGAFILNNQISSKSITKAYNDKYCRNLSEYEMYKEMDKESEVYLTVEGFYDTKKKQEYFQRKIHYSVKKKTSFQFIDTMLNQ